MDFSGFYHQMKSNYAYAVGVNTLHIRIRTGKSAAERMTLIIFDPFNWRERKDKPGDYAFNEEKCQRLPMQREHQVGGFDYWFVEATVPTKRAKYAFIAENGTESFLYTQHTIVPFTAESRIEEHLFMLFSFPYILAEDLFHAPDWVKNTVWYQIFPERYANSGKIVHKEAPLPWGSEAEVNNRQRYGGDLYGVVAHLDELQTLGITGIYFTPIFKSPSTHKYNTEDYFQIDPAFGDNAVFGELMREAHKRGIRVMLDLVFNHIGSTHPFWQDVLENGKKSKYYNCFYVKRDDLGDTSRADDLPYETFATVPAMPKWNTADPFARQYLLDVAVYWARTYGVDGFRLDVANEVSHDFWRAFRKTVRAVNPALYIVGEVWEHAEPWLMGDQFDAVMNYPLAVGIWGFVSGKMDGAAFADAASAYMTSYPRNRQTVLFNLIGSHDTGRIMTVAKGSTERVMQAFALLFSFAGSPCVFYGDEVGLSGEGMDRARVCMEWDEAKQNKSLYAFVKRMITLRASRPSMRSVDLRWLKHDAEGVIYLKTYGNEQLAVLLNGQDEAVNMTMPEELAGKTVRDIINDRDINIKETMQIPPYGTALWLMR